LAQACLQSPLHSIHILASNDPRFSVFATAAKSKILGHDPIDLNGVDASLLKSLRKGNDVRCAVKLTSLDEALCPSENGSDGVGRRLVSFLVFAVVTGDGAMGSLGLKGLSIWCDEDRGHKTEGAETLSNDIGLHITVIVYFLR
jgi:hypothetical protein